MIREFIRQMCQELEIRPIPVMNEKKFIPFRLGPHIEVEVRDLEPGVSFFSSLAPCPEHKREELFLTLTQANYLGQKTGASRIGLTRDEKFLTLSAGFPYDMSYRAFQEGIEEFINFLLYWREEMKTFEQEMGL